jgi:hypothetical protein
MGMNITDSSGTKRKVRGLIAAISEDECKTWSNVKLVTDDGPGKSATSTDGGCFAFSQRNSEYRGYMSACQTPNGLVHLVTSRSHYAFNLAWLKTPNEPAERTGPSCNQQVTLRVQSCLAKNPQRAFEASTD